MGAKTTERTAKADVTGWRSAQLHAAGFSALLATRLAANRCYDLHALIELVERGCDPDFAARILAPDDEDAAA